MPEKGKLFNLLKTPAEDARQSGADYGELAAYFNPPALTSYDRPHFFIY